EGAALFAAPLQVLYTRRIGQVPAAPVLPGDEKLTADPGPSQPWAAAKLTGTLGADTRFGALAAVTGANRIPTEDAAVPHERLIDPGTVSGALRGRHGLGKRGYVGMFMTAVGRYEDGGYPVAGGMVYCPDDIRVLPGARCTHDAVVAGVDSRWRSPSGA